MGGDGLSDSNRSDEKQRDPECILQITKAELAIGLDLRGERGVTDDA